MISINGKVYHGNNISISDNEIVIDGVTMENTSLEVTIIGDVENLKVDGSCTVKGNVGNASSGGSMKCENISGNANSGGSMKCGDVGGNANSGGSMKRN